MSAADQPFIVWSIRAKRRLQQALVRHHVQTGESIDMAQQMESLERALKLAFEHAEEVVVSDQVLGFRSHDHEYILVVEVHGSRQSGNYVVKIKQDDPLRAELEAWNGCRPAGLHHDIVFMTLDPIYDGPDRLVALVYEDAQQFIQVDRTSSLEDAFLSSVLHGTPSPASVANVLTELFARIGHLLYRGACPVNPAGPTIRLNVDRKLDDYLDRWDRAGDPQNARRIAIASQPFGQDGFYDPIDFFRYLLDGLANGEPPEACIPRMLRGSAHGDLHGRNVLVGIVEDEAHWPALFDYEDMGIDNLVGWDLAKLETELKIRAYRDVFSGRTLLDRAACISRFEVSLGEATEQCRRLLREWPAPEGDSPAQRLFNLLMVLRRLAGKHLGDAHGRSAHWLEELYFLLGCYGVYAGKFDNLNEIELLGAFLSAGVAAARFSYSRARRLGAGTGVTTP